MRSTAVAANPFQLPRAPSTNLPRGPMAATWGVCQPRQSQRAQLTAYTPPPTRDLVNHVLGPLPAPGPGSHVLDILKHHIPQGDLSPKGITAWLHSEEDYELLLDTATHGADLQYHGQPPFELVENRVDTALHTEVTR